MSQALAQAESADAFAQVRACAHARPVVRCVAPVARQQGGGDRPRLDRGHGHRRDLRPLDRPARPERHPAHGLRQHPTGLARWRHLGLPARHRFPRPRRTQPADLRGQDQHDRRHHPDHHRDDDRDQLRPALRLARRRLGQHPDAAGRRGLRLSVAAAVHHFPGRPPRDLARPLARRADAAVRGVRHHRAGTGSPGWCAGRR